MNSNAFTRLANIIETLRSPGGCPWDREQTASSIRSNLIEEAWEIVEAINDADDDHLCEEVGDILLVVLLMAQIKKEEGAFSVSDALNMASEKLIRRHPHVFDSNHPGVEDAEATMKQWEIIKQKVEGREKASLLLDQIPKTLPPLAAALKMQTKAAGVGFDWKDKGDIIDKINEEIAEFKEVPLGEEERREEEMGDILFSLVNFSRREGIDPSIALEKTNRKFKRRFSEVEKEMRNNGKTLSAASLTELDEVWNSIKIKEKNDE